MFIHDFVGMDMPKKPTKALRGKRRWVGFQCLKGSTEVSVRRDLSSLGAKLVQYDNGRAILSVKLSNYEELLKSINGLGHKTLTSSGKIRLVRERIGLEKDPFHSKS